MEGRYQVYPTNALEISSSEIKINHLVARSSPDAILMSEVCTFYTSLAFLSQLSSPYFLDFLTFIPFLAVYRGIEYA
jgi:hypothetical protein